MAVTPFQSGILRSLADQRRRRGESYVAGGVALNELLAAPRRSRDIDLFHDSETALAATWEADGEALRGLGYTLEVIRLAPSFAEALVARGTDRSLRCTAPRRTRRHSRRSPGSSPRCPRSPRR